MIAINECPESTDTTSNGTGTGPGAGTDNGSGSGTAQQQQKEQQQQQQQERQEENNNNVTLPQQSLPPSLPPPPPLPPSLQPPQDFDCEYAERVMNMSLFDPPRWGWTAVGGVADLLSPHEVRAQKLYYNNEDVYVDVDVILYYIILYYTTIYILPSVISPTRKRRNETAFPFPNVLVLVLFYLIIYLPPLFRFVCSDHGDVVHVLRTKRKPKE